MSTWPFGEMVSLVDTTMAAHGQVCGNSVDSSMGKSMDKAMYKSTDKSMDKSISKGTAGQILHQRWFTTATMSHTQPPWAIPKPQWWSLLCMIVRGCQHEPKNREMSMSLYESLWAFMSLSGLLWFWTVLQEMIRDKSICESPPQDFITVTTISEGSSRSICLVVFVAVSVEQSR